MFKFEFESDKLSTTPAGSTLNRLQWLPSKEILLSDAPKTKSDQLKEAEVIKIGSEELLYIKPSTILHALKDEIDENIFLAEQNHSDLVPAKYEGGLKVWECTHDIAKFLDPSYVSGKSVLDLGCGVGLLGILALKMGADSVHFQDYNADVLRYATMANVQLNVDQHQMDTCHFFSGDWESFAELTQSTYDLIISSETIYNPDNHLKLHNTFQRVLKPSGTVLMGAKSYYFGVGGSTRQFEKMVQTRGIFDIEVVWKYSKGVQREILKLTFKAAES